MLSFAAVGRKTTIAEGKGAGALASPNLRRPLRKVTSPNMQCSCHHLVSVLAGSKQTTVAPFLIELSWAFFTQAPIPLPYGGFIQQTPRHSCLSPSCCGEKNAWHFAFSGTAHTSNSKSNRSFHSSNTCCGVAHISVALLKCTAIFDGLRALVI